VTYWGSDRGPRFEILVDGISLGIETQDGSGARDFVEKRYPLPAEVLAKTAGRRITVRFVGKGGNVGNIYELRLMKPEEPRPPSPSR
jgi:hypothetical protein